MTKRLLPLISILLLVVTGDCLAQERRTSSPSGTSQGRTTSPGNNTSPSRPGTAPSTPSRHPSPGVAKRVDISNHLLGVLEYAEGFMKESDGQWWTRTNRIPQYFADKRDLVMVDQLPYDDGHDNFISYEFREIDHRGPDGRKCIVMIHRYRGGFWDDPSRRVGYNYSKSVVYYVFALADFDRLNASIVNNTTNIIEVDLLFKGYIERLRSDDGYISMVEEHFYQKRSEGLQRISYYPQELMFIIHPNTQTGSVRFNICTAEYEILTPQSRDVKYGKAQPGKRIKSLHPSFTINKVRIVDPNVLFGNAYYETGFNDFSRFIQLSMPVQQPPSPNTVPQKPRRKIGSFR